MEAWRRRYGGRMGLSALRSCHSQRWKLFRRSGFSTAGRPAARFLPPGMSRCSAWNWAASFTRLAGRDHRRKVATNQVLSRAGTAIPCLLRRRGGDEGAPCSDRGGGLAVRVVKAGLELDPSNAEYIDTPLAPPPRSHRIGNLSTRYRPAAPLYVRWSYRDMPAGLTGWYSRLGVLKAPGNSPK
jgi:hypothetical protein